MECLVQVSQNGMVSCVFDDAKMASCRAAGCSSGGIVEYSVNPVQVDDMGLLRGYPVATGGKLMDELRR